MFLENGQTKSFKYDSSTTVQDVIDSLVAKLGIRDSAHFSLVVEHIKSLRRNKLTILDPRERLAVVSCIFGPVFISLRRRGNNEVWERAVHMGLMID